MEAITGYASVFYREGDKGTEFELWDGAVERINPKAFNSALKRKDNVRGLYNHNPDHLLGSTDAGTMKLSKDDKGLRYDIPFDENDPDHQRVASKIARGDLKGSSFAFRIDSEKWTRDKDGLEIREILDLTLYDVGPVTFPAYSGATADSRQVRSVDLEGHTLEVRSADITSARASYDAWQAEIRAEQEQEAEQRRLQVATLERRLTMLG